MLVEVLPVRLVPPGRLALIQTGGGTPRRTNSSTVVATKQFKTKAVPRDELGATGWGHPGTSTTASPYASQVFKKMSAIS